MSLPKIGDLVRHIESGVYFEINDKVPADKKFEVALYVLVNSKTMKVKSLKELREEYRGCPLGKTI